MAPKQPNRRRHKRVKTSYRTTLSEYASILLRRPGSEARTIDISAGGILVETDKKFNVNDTVKIEIYIPLWGQFKKKFYSEDIPDEQPLSVVGTIVRTVPLAEGRCQLGIVFSVIKDADRDVLTKYIREKLWG